MYAVGIIVVVVAAVAAKEEMAGYQNCTSEKPMEDCCFVNTTTLLCQHGCPDTFYNVTLDDAFGIHDDNEFFKKLRETFNKDLIWLHLASNKVPDPTEYSLCKQCDVACANCSGPGDALCLSCAGGYRREAPNLDRCNKVALKHQTTGTVSSRHTYTYIVGIVAPVVFVFIIILLYQKRQRFLFFVAGLKSKALAEDQTVEAGLKNVLQPEQQSEQPLFSRSWDLYEDFDSSGGFLRGKQSDVRLVLPEGAVKDTHRVKGAICTDLNKVRRKLDLPENEHIVSPVAEYHAGPKFRFQQPVHVILPHFLPPSWPEDAVIVYKVQRGEQGEITVATLKLGHKGSDGHPAGGQYYINNDRVHIFTDHFTAFVVCTVCSKEVLLQPLVLDVWAKHVELEQEQDSSRLVEVRLYIWIGAKYMIKDFRASILPVDDLDNFKDMKRIDIKPFQVYRGDESGACLKAELHVTDQMEKMWQHCFFRGKIKYPESANVALGDLVHCDCTLPYQLVEWQLTNQTEVTPSNFMQCCVIVGYVTKDGGCMDEPGRVMIEVEIEKSADPQGVARNDKVRRSSSLGSTSRGSEPDNTSESSVSVYTDEALLLKTHSRESRRQKQRSGMSTSSSSSGESPSRRSEPTLNFNADNVTNVTIVMSGSDPLLTSGPDERDDAEDELHA